MLFDNRPLKVPGSVVKVVKRCALQSLMEWHKCWLNVGVFERGRLPNDVQCRGRWGGMATAARSWLHGVAAFKVLPVQL